MASRASGLDSCDRFRPAMVLVVRNVAIATAVVVTVLSRVALIVFATASLLDPAPSPVAALLLFRSTGSSHPPEMQRGWSGSRLVPGSRHSLSSGQGAGRGRSRFTSS